MNDNVTILFLVLYYLIRLYTTQKLHSCWYWDGWFEVLEYIMLILKVPAVVPPSGWRKGLAVFKVMWDTIIGGRKEEELTLLDEVKVKVMLNYKRNLLRSFLIWTYVSQLYFLLAPIVLIKKNIFPTPR